jgi:hypothetical protein
VKDFLDCFDEILGGKLIRMGGKLPLHSPLGLIPGRGEEKRGNGEEGGKGYMKWRRERGKEGKGTVYKQTCALFLKKDLIGIVSRSSCFKPAS